MIAPPVPYHKLEELRQCLGLLEADLELLNQFLPVIVQRKDEFARRFRDAFTRLPETKMLLENEARPRFLLNAWARWIELLFSGRLDHDFFAYLWRIGARHVDVNLDQRFSNLGFALARQFCQQVVYAEADPGLAARLSRSIDKILDFCVLVETSAYVETATRCDVEVIRGVADRVRTPATVIGATLKRLQRKGTFTGEGVDVLEALIYENQRLERMVLDIETYSNVFTREPEFVPCALDPFVRKALAKLSPREKLERTRVEVHIDPSAPSVLGDPQDIEFLLTCLLQNALDAVDGPEPSIRVSSRPTSGLSPTVDIEIFNTGRPPEREDIEHFFSPFYSNKSWGTGFGLPTAKIAVRKNFGKLDMQPVPGVGTRVTVTLSKAS